MYKKRRCCFTLIEIMIVMVIVLSMVTALSMNIGEAMRQQRFLSGAREILNRLQMAQDLMLMQHESVRVIFKRCQDPVPHIECLVKMGIHEDRQGIKALAKILEQTKAISGVADLQFIDAAGLVHGLDNGKEIEIKFISQGNYVKSGILRIYEAPQQGGAQQAIALQKYPSPLKLVEGNSISLSTSQAVAVQSSDLFPIPLPKKQGNQ